MTPRRARSKRLQRSSTVRARPMSRALPAYVERGGDLVFPPPYRARGVKNFMFTLDADPAALDGLFTRSFAEPSGGAVDIRPESAEVILTVVEIDAINATEPPHSQISAGGPELEVAFWVFGHDVQSGRRLLFMPYMFIDSAPAAVAGREIFGFPKQHGMFPVMTGDPLRELSLCVPGVKSYDPAVPFARHRLLDIEAVAPAKTAAMIVAPSVGFRKLETFMAGPTITAVFLKQFRDVVQPDRACYQAIVEADIAVTDFFGATELGGYTITLHDLATTPIRRDLGLPAGPLRPTAAARTHYEFVLLRGTERWRAPA